MFQVLLLNLVQCCYLFVLKMNAFGSVSRTLLGILFYCHIECCYHFVLLFFRITINGKINALFELNLRLR